MAASAAVDVASTANSNANAMPRPVRLDERWKPSKKEPFRRSSSSSASAAFASSNCSKSSTSSSSSRSRRRCAFTTKCARLVREQRARFYIMRRCVTMLLCSRDYGD